LELQKLTNAGHETARILTNPSNGPDVAILRWVNKTLGAAGPQSGHIRVDDPSDPIGMLTARVFLEGAQDLVDDGYITFPFGDGMARHTEPKLIPEKLEIWQSELTKAASLGQREYVDAIAHGVRTCIAIHPFEDGNGRSCRTWAAYALAQRKEYHPLLWQGEDVSLMPLRWESRFAAAVALHREFVEDLLKQPCCER
jgi:hypothetical protein